VAIIRQQRLIGRILHRTVTQAELVISTRDLELDSQSLFLLDGFVLYPILQSFSLQVIGFCSVYTATQSTAACHLWLARIYDCPDPGCFLASFFFFLPSCFPIFLIRQLFSSFSQRLSPRSFVGWAGLSWAGLGSPKLEVDLFYYPMDRGSCGFERAMAGLLSFSCRAASSCPCFVMRLLMGVYFRFCPVIFCEILGAYGGCVYAAYLAVWRFVAYSRGVRLFLVPG
jgi:hypothetical protein